MSIKTIEIGDVTILNADCRVALNSMPDNSVDCCVTSPPYFGLRSYGHDDQIGLEDTLEEYVEEMRKVFAEVRRVLKPEGTCWLNLGDSYAGSGKGGQSDRMKRPNWDPDYPKPKHIAGFKPKDLMGVPWRVAFALQADGWWLRQDIVWQKNNPLPESVKDRCTNAHEYIFLLSKSLRYYFDNKAIQEASVYAGDRRGDRKDSRRGERMMNSMSGNTGEYRNKRSVWSVPTQAYDGAHFAVFPSELIRPCIKAGCPKGGTVLDPFGGSGTTGRVALEEGCKAVLIELNPDYVPLIVQRVQQGVLSI